VCLPRVLDQPQPERLLADAVAARVAAPHHAKHTADRDLGAKRVGAEHRTGQGPQNLPEIAAFGAELNLEQRILDS
jgi:hypothetical protein